MKEKRNRILGNRIFRMVISYLLIVGMTCSSFSCDAVFAAETKESIPTIRLYLEKPEGWTTPAFHVWNEDAVVNGDGEVFVQAWDASETKLFKEASSGFYYVDVTLKGWHGFQFIDAESGDEIKVDKNAEADADILATLSQMTEDISVYYLEKNGTYGWYMDANGTKPLEIPATIYANIHFYNEQEWKTPCIDAWVDGVTTTYTNVGTQTDIKGWDHTLPSMKLEKENWYTATVQVTGKLSGMQFADAKTGNIITLDAEQLATINTCTKETPTDVYYGYETISFKKEDIPIPKKLVKRQSPVYHTDGTVTFHLATEEQEAGIKGTFTNWLTMPMEPVSEAEDGFVGFTATVKVPTEGGIYTYGMVTGEEEQWIGDPENKSKTDNPVVVRNPEIGNGTVTIYWPATEAVNGKVTYRKYGSKDTYKEAEFKPVADAQNLYAAEIDRAESGKKYEYTIKIDGKVQEDIYNFASKESGVATFIPCKKITEPDYDSPVIQEDGTVTFHYWNPSAMEVKLAGDMTNWASDAIVMEKNSENGLFTATIHVPAGSYGYKFIVDGNWVLDEKNKKTTEGADRASLLEISYKETSKPTITPTAQITATSRPTRIPEETAIPSVKPTMVPSAAATSTVGPSILPTETVNPLPEETAVPSSIPSMTPVSSAIPKESPAVSYTITYVLNKGKNHKNNPAFYTTEDVNLKAPARVGYTFAGWYTDENFTEKITVIKAAEKKNITVYAKWNKVKKPAKVKKVTVTNKKGMKVRITVKKVQGAKGYEILYTKDRKFKKSVKKINIAGNVKTIGKLKKNHTYYVKIRSYKIDSAGKKVYGAYSSVKKVRITK